MSQQYHGSCLCSAVTFSVKRFSDKAANCHCSMCRKFHGAAFGTLVSVEGVEWLSGVGYLKHFTAPNGTVRTFCRECGSSLGFREKGMPETDIELAVATFDEPIPVKIDAQIYTHYKANWCDLHDHLPQHEEGREG